MSPEKMKEIRTYLNLSQENFAHKLGVTTGTYNRWESGRVKPSPLAMEKINVFNFKIPEKKPVEIQAES